LEANWFVFPPPPAFESDGEILEILERGSEKIVVVGIADGNAQEWDYGIFAQLFPTALRIYLEEQRLLAVVD
jgi:hypothetical protein